MKLTIKNSIPKVMVMVVLATTLQSCFVAKDYVRPDFEETEQLYRTDNLP